MKLNPDCIRDVLLTVEEHTGLSRPMHYPNAKEYELFQSYSPEEVFYHINQCELSGLLTEVNWFIGRECLIHDLSPAGHEFLANIRNDNNWNKTKEVAKNVGSFSLSTLKEIASSVIAGIISSQINKN
ncbi:DUF2513 domain-containing protein [Paenibacillus apiarius]|uniref:DUF2513 domain-containing protein n=1 Tax=Paenibacillus apiarius TaxID=46240 RepID=UPI003B3B9795